MIFLDNKYTKWYYRIINSAQTRNEVRGYIEKHHIIPKSLGGGNNEENLVKLTAREHFICHWLLVKMTPEKEKTKMFYALYSMRMNSKSKFQERYQTKITSRVYQNHKEKFIKLHAENLKGSHWPGDEEYKVIRLALTKDRVHSAESRAKRVIAMQGKNTGARTDEEKENISRSKKGKPWTTAKIMSYEKKYNKKFLK